MLCGESTGINAYICKACHSLNSSDLILAQQLFSFDYLKRVERLSGISLGLSPCQDVKVEEEQENENEKKELSNVKQEKQIINEPFSGVFMLDQKRRDSAEKKACKAQMELQKQKQELKFEKKEKVKRKNVPFVGAVSLERFQLVHVDPGGVCIVVSNHMAFQMNLTPMNQRKTINAHQEKQNQKGKVKKYTQIAKRRQQDGLWRN